MWDNSPALAQMKDCMHNRILAGHVGDLDIECCPKAKNENTSRNEWHGFNKGISRSFLPVHTWKPVYSMLKSFSFSLITGKYMSQLISRYIALHVQKFSKDQQVLFFARHWKTVWKKHANKKERQHKFTWRSYLRHFGNDMYKRDTAIYLIFLQDIQNMRRKIFDNLRNMAMLVNF